MATPAPILAPAAFRPEPHLRVVRAMVVAEERATSSVPRKVLLLVASVALGFVLALVLRAQSERQIDPDQAWFWTPEWLAGELEADAEMAAGRGRFFESDEAFLAHLDEVDTE
jgi:hypothetical protein